MEWEESIERQRRGIERIWGWREKERRGEKEWEDKEKEEEKGEHGFIFWGLLDEWFPVLGGPVLGVEEFGLDSDRLLTFPSQISIFRRWELLGIASWAYQSIVDIYEDIYINNITTGEVQCYCRLLRSWRNMPQIFAHWGSQEGNYFPQILEFSRWWLLLISLILPGSSTKKTLWSWSKVTSVTWLLYFSKGYSWKEA